jgi:hypothetical protein
MAAISSPWMAAHGFTPEVRCRELKALPLSLYPASIKWRANRENYTCVQSSGIATAYDLKRIMRNPLKHCQLSRSPEL